MSHRPFQVGELAESRSFQAGYRGAWFRCKIRGIRTKNGVVSYQLEYFDYPDQKLQWIKSYQKPLTNTRKSKGFNRELMVRPLFPSICYESEKPDLNAISEVMVVVDSAWKVGNLVDWWTDGCYWSGRVTKMLGNGKVQVDLVPPPHGEGLSYEAFSKDLRPSLDWCPENGWTVPTPTLQEGAYGHPCARIINPANTGGVVNTDTTDGMVKVGQPTARTFSLHSSQNSEGLKDSPDESMAMRELCYSSRGGMMIDTANTKIGRNCFSSANLAMSTVDDGYNDKYPSKKMRSNRCHCLNSMSSNTIEASILDLEELVNRIKWLRGVLDFGVPMSGTKQPSWEFLQHRAPCK